MRRLGAALALVVVASSARAAVLQRVEVTGGGQPTVRLTLSEPTAVPEPATLAGVGDARRRLYLDLPAARGAGIPAVIPGTGPVLRVRVGQLGAKTRVVLDLAEPVPYEVDADGAAIVVALGAGSRAASPAAAPPARPAETPAVRVEPRAARGMLPAAGREHAAAPAVGPPRHGPGAA